MSVVLRAVPRFEKYPNEVINQAVDFTEILDTGETIITATVTAKRYDTGADATSDVINGSPTVLTGTSVSYQLTGGTASLTYILNVSATLDSAEIYSQRIRMDVVDIPE